MSQYDGWCALPRPTTLNFSSLEPEGSTSIPNAYIESRLLISHVGEQMMTKAKMLQNQFRNMVIMAFHYAPTSKIWDFFKWARWKLIMTSIHLLCRKLVRIFVTWNRCANLGCVELNLFTRHFHFFFSPPIQPL